MQSALGDASEFNSRRSTKPRVQKRKYARADGKSSAAAKSDLRRQPAGGERERRRKSSHRDASRVAHSTGCHQKRECRVGLWALHFLRAALIIKGCDFWLVGHKICRIKLLSSIPFRTTHSSIKLRVKFCCQKCIFIKAADLWVNICFDEWIKYKILTKFILKAAHTETHVIFALLLISLDVNCSNISWGLTKIYKFVKIRKIFTKLEKPLVDFDYQQMN